MVPLRPLRRAGFRRLAAYLHAQRARVGASGPSRSASLVFDHTHSALATTALWLCTLLLPGARSGRRQPLASIETAPPGGRFPPSTSSRPRSSRCWRWCPRAVAAVRAAARRPRRDTRARRPRADQGGGRRDAQARGRARAGQHAVERVLLAVLRDRARSRRPGRRDLWRQRGAVGQRRDLPRDDDHAGHEPRAASGARRIPATVADAATRRHRPCPGQPRHPPHPRRPCVGAHLRGHDLAHRGHLGQGGHRRRRRRLRRRPQRLGAARS